MTWVVGFNYPDSVNDDLTEPQVKENGVSLHITIVYLMYLSIYSLHKMLLSLENQSRYNHWKPIKW